MSDTPSTCATSMDELMMRRLFHDPCFVVDQLRRQGHTDDDITSTLTELATMVYRRPYLPDDTPKPWWVLPPLGACLPKWRITLTPTTRASLQDARGGLHV